MKLFLALLVMGVCVFVFVSQQQRSQEVVEAPPEPVATPAPVATPEPNYFAPDGIYFLTAAVSITTEDGVVGLKPGSQMIKTGDDVYQSGPNEVKLQPNQVTNDLRVARQILLSNHASEEALRSWQRQNEQAAREAEEDRLAAAAAAAAARPVVQQSSNADAEPSTTSLRQGPYNQQRARYQKLLYTVDPSGRVIYYR